MSLNVTFSAGNVLTAAHMNGIQAAWDSFTPTWTAATTAPAVGDGTLTGRYLRIGKTIIVRITLAAGASTTQGTGVQAFALPVAAHATAEQALHFKIYTGSANFVGNGYIPAGSSTVRPFVPTSTGNCDLVQVASTTPNVGTTGVIVIEGTYEAA